MTDKKVDACAIPSVLVNHSQGSVPSVAPANGSVIPTSTPLMNGPISDSARDFAKRGSATPAEALVNDPRHNPVKP